MQVLSPDSTLQNEREEQSISIASVLKRRRKSMLITFITILIVSFVIALLLPPVYRSSATILIEQQEMPQDFVRSTVSTFADQRIEVISQRVMTSANLWEIIKKFDLYADKRLSEPREVVIERMRGDIKKQMISADVMDPRSGRPVQATIAFKISYDNGSAELAQKVANELTSLFLNENLKSRAELAGQASSFMQDEAEKLRGNISENERKIAEFKQKNDGMLPDMLQFNLQAAERAERDVSEMDRQIVLLNNRITTLKTELAKLTPQSALMTDTGERVMSPEGRLKYLESQYASLVASYSPNHPDVIRTKREMDALRVKVGEVDNSQALAQKRVTLEADLDGAQKKYAADHPDVKRLKQALKALDSEIALNSASASARKEVTADNPTWIQFNTEMTAANDEVRTLKLRRDELKSQMDMYRDRTAKMPQVERDYRAMMLDYENAVHKYQETRNKQMEAQLAQSLETERKGERLTLVEPPLLAEKPVKPNRIALFLLGLLVSFGAATASGIIAEKNDDTFWGRESLYRTLGATPLVAVPYIKVTAENKQVRINQLIVAGLLVFFLISMLAFVHYEYKPLDVIWFILMRKLGI